MEGLDFIQWFVGLVSFAYAGMVIWLTQGWFRLPVYPNMKKDPETKLTLLIPVKNEISHVSELIEWILNLNYPKHLLEVLIVDDYSSDDTFEKLQYLIVEHHFIQVILNENEGGKKSALSFGVHQATGDLIVTSDADCNSGKNWLIAMANHYERYRPKFISGPVRIIPANSFLTRFQALEFSSLIASGAGAIHNKRPIMCNGANLAYEKKAFVEVGGYDGNETFSSGDDVFLMWKMQKQFGEDAVQFINAENAIVNTLPVDNFRQFVNQRIRWVSKSKGYKDYATIAVAIIVLLFNVILFSGFFVYLAPERILMPLVFAWVIKLIVDLPLLYGITRFNRQTKLLLWYMPIQMLTVAYTVIFGVAGQFSSFSWKGNKSHI